MTANSQGSASLRPGDRRRGAPLLPRPRLPAARGDRPRRIRRIERELVLGFSTLGGIGKAVSVFGSARTPRGHRDYELAREVAGCLGGRDRIVFFSYTLSDKVAGLRGDYGPNNRRSTVAVVSRWSYGP